MVSSYREFCPSSPARPPLPWRRLGAKEDGENRFRAVRRSRCDRLTGRPISSDKCVLGADRFP